MCSTHTMNLIINNKCLLVYCTYTLLSTVNFTKMVFKKYKSKNKKWNSKMFFHTNYKTGKKKFEAMFVECFGYTFWFWRTKEIYHDWPNAA